MRIPIWKLLLLLLLFVEFMAPEMARGSVPYLQFLIPWYPPSPLLFDSLDILGLEHLLGHSEALWGGGEEDVTNATSILKQGY